MQSFPAMERATYTTKSFIIALALVNGRITTEQAARASQVEVASQIERWGEVEDCTYDYHFISFVRFTHCTSSPRRRLP
jgi:chaperone required for assembly of F1-ATPase